MPGWTKLGPMLAIDVLSFAVLLALEDLIEAEMRLPATWSHPQRWSRSPNDSMPMSP